MVEGSGNFWKTPALYGLSSLLLTRPIQRPFSAVSLTSFQLLDSFHILISVAHSFLEVVLLKCIGGSHWSISTFLYPAVSDKHWDFYFSQLRKVVASGRGFWVYPGCSNTMTKMTQLLCLGSSYSYGYTKTLSPRQKHFSYSYQIPLTESTAGSRS